MRIDSAFPGQYLKAADLQGREVTVTMSHVKMEDVGGEEKPVLYFSGKDRGLCLNKTNANNIAHVYGHETDDWHGKSLTLYEAMVDYQGRSTPAIRVKVPRIVPDQQRRDSISSGVPQRVTGGISDNMAPAGHPINDDIPF